MRTLRRNWEQRPINPRGVNLILPHTPRRHYLGCAKCKKKKEPRPHVIVVLLVWLNERNYERIAFLSLGSFLLFFYLSSHWAVNLKNGKIFHIIFLLYINCYSRTFDSQKSSRELITLLFCEILSVEQQNPPTCPFIQWSKRQAYI